MAGLNTTRRGISQLLGEIYRKNKSNGTWNYCQLLHDFNYLVSEVSTLLNRKMHSFGHSIVHVDTYIMQNFYNIVPVTIVVDIDKWEIISIYHNEMMERYNVVNSISWRWLN